MTRRANEDGTALVEFFWLGILLLVPLIYAILFAFQMQRASFAVTEATRSAGRAFLTTPTGIEADAESRAQAAATLTLKDHGVPDAEPLAMECRDGTCFTPGALVRITLTVKVHLPLLSAFGLQGGTVSVTGVHDEVFDTYADYAKAG